MEASRPEHRLPVAVDGEDVNNRHERLHFDALALSAVRLPRAGSVGAGADNRDQAGRQGMPLYLLGGTAPY